MSVRFAFALVTLSLVLMLGACGNKSPLIKPVPTTPSNNPPVVLPDPTEPATNPPAHGNAKPGELV